MQFIELCKNHSRIAKLSELLRSDSPRGDGHVPLYQSQLPHPNDTPSIINFKVISGSKFIRGKVQDGFKSAQCSCGTLSGLTLILRIFNPNPQRMFPPLSPRLATSTFQIGPHVLRRTEANKANGSSFKGCKSRFNLLLPTLSDKSESVFNVTPSCVFAETADDKCSS